jgi:hypothetical protein
MSTQQSTMGTKRAQFADPNTSDIANNMGIYIGVVKAIDTSFRTGRISIYIPAFGGNPKEPSSWYEVTYASPYLGTTTAPPGDPQFNSFAYTKQTYGFYMTPPDIGNQVLCCFPEGKAVVGYWFACISNQLSKTMLPANGAVPWNDIDPASLTTSDAQRLFPYLKQGTPYPVGEFNENDSNVFTNSWTKNKKPLNFILTEQLIRQGLDNDPSRGAISSSIQRDPISTVFGVSSPGRPFPGQDPKNNPNLQSKLATGNFNPQDFVVTGRVTGHTFIMDDGDIYGKTNLTRWKSASGHQIIMNDTDGFIYISNAPGTAWVELTASGDILIYSARDIALRTQGNLMIQSDRNINFNAEQSINLNAGLDINLESARAIQTNAGQFLNLYGRQTQLKSGGAMSINSSSAMSIKSGGGMALTGRPINLNGQGGGGEQAPPRKLPQYLSADSIFTSTGWQVRTNSIQSICYKIPTHEPYIRGSVSQLIAIQEQVASISEGIDTSTTTVDGTTVQAPIVGASNNVEQAKTEPIERPAPASTFIKQPDPGQGLGSLSSDQLRAYLAQTGYTESGGNYKPIDPGSTVEGVNRLGYAGKYQLGSLALQELGYLKADTPQTIDAINNPANWIGGQGKPASLQAFLDSPQIQEGAAYALTKNNYNTLQLSGLITATTSAADIAGLLSASHLGGAGGTIKWYNGGINSTDTFGTSISQNFNRGRYSQSQVSIIQASNASKTTLGV